VGGGPDYVFQNWWYFRVNGVSTREHALPGTGVTANNGTDDVTYTVNNVAASFNASLNATLQSFSTTESLLMQSLTLTNTTAGALSLAIFHYLDYDVDGSTLNTGTWVDQSKNHMRITRAATGMYGEYKGFGADAYQVGPWASIRNLLTNSTIDNFNNTGMPFGPADWTGGFQWDLVLAPGASVTVQVGMSTNSLIPQVPAPGALALLGLAGLAGVRRRRD
jgi:MYXO-CTERM domain-containing protein